MAVDQPPRSFGQHKELKPKGKRHHGRKAKPLSDEPPDNSQRNFTDPDSWIMIDDSSKAFVYGYNYQAAVDEHSQIIIATGTSQQSNDKKQIEPMLKEIKKNTKAKP